MMAGDMNHRDSNHPNSPGRPASVLIAGGGFAAIEAMLALRALAGERVGVTLISASTALAYRPAATTEVFDATGPLTYGLQDLAGNVGASFRPGRLEAVFPKRRRVRLASDAHLDYDVLVLALGARPISAIPGALVFRDQRDIHLIRDITSKLRAGGARRVVFAVPPARSWPLPLYELALGAAARLREARAAGEVVLVSPETAPLRVFGARASALVADLLAERGVRFIGGADPVRVGRDGALALRSGGSVDADRVITAPRLLGPRITGVPADREGFVTTDALGGVTDLPDVYAAGDMTSFPIKHGGLATQQADVIAQRIAADRGALVKEIQVKHVLHAQLVGGEHPIVLRTELDEFGQPTTATLQHEHPAPDSLQSPAKVHGRYLEPYLHARTPDAPDLVAARGSAPGWSC
jgi:sulfide:quinone oxidoreductase